MLTIHRFLACRCRLSPWPA